MRDKVLSFIQQDEYPQLKLESLWIVSNFFSGTAEYTAILYEKAIPLLIDCLENRELEIVNNAIWALSNLSCDSVVYRDILLMKGVMGKMVSLLKRIEYLKKPKIEENILWGISNLSRSTPFPNFGLIRAGILTLIRKIGLAEES